METADATSSLHSAVNSLLECSICLETYEDPRNLPCGHTFCLRCIQANANRTCALCNRPWSLPIGGLQGLPKNFVLDSFISTLPSVKKNAFQTSHSVNCRDPICAVCSKICVEDADNDDGGTASDEQSRILVCLEHSEEEVVMYCTQCQQCVCQTCILTSHVSHSSISLDEADQHLTEYIKKSVNELEKLATRYKKKMKRTTKIMNGLDKERRTISDVINSFMNDVKKTLEETLEKLKAEVDQSRTAAIELINESTEEEKQRLAAIKSEAEEKLKRVQRLVQQHENHLSISLSAVDRAKFILSKSFNEHSALKYVGDINNTQLADVSKWQNDVTKWLQQAAPAVKVPNLTRQNENYILAGQDLATPGPDLTAPDQQSVNIGSPDSINGLISPISGSQQISSNEQQVCTQEPIAEDQLTLDNQPASAEAISSVNVSRSNQGITRSSNASSFPQPDATRNLTPRGRTKFAQSQSVDNHLSTARGQVTDQPSNSQQIRQTSSSNQLTSVSQSSSRTQQAPSNQSINRPRSVSSDESARDRQVSHRRSVDSSKVKHQNTHILPGGQPSFPAEIQRLPRLRAATFVRTLVIPQLKDNDVTMVSAHKDKLLVSSWGSSQLYIYTLDGRYISTISVPGMLFDVTWTPRGDIACTTRHNHKVIILSQGGTIITQTEMTNPQCLSVSTNDVMYLADWQNGIYESSDGGANWSRVFQSREGVQCWQVIEIPTKHGEIFWTLERKDSKYRLCAFNANVKRSDNSLSWRDVAVPATGETAINLASSRLGHDGHAYVFLTDQQNNAVHVFSLGGQYQFQLLSSQQINTPWRLAFDTNYGLLYVGQSRGEVKVFALAYQ